MADLQQAMQALRNAHNAGDVEAATRLAGIVRKLQSTPQQPSGGSAADRLRALYASQPTVEAPPRESTMTEEFMRTLRGTLSSGRTGLASLVGDENEQARAGLERSAAIGEDYGVGPSFEKVKETYDEEGLLAAIAEGAGQIPRYVAQQIPTLAQGIIGAKAGAMVPGPLPVKALAAALGGAAAFLPSFAGSNIERRAQEQQEAGQEVDVDVGGAYGTALGQSSLQAVGGAAVLGKNIVRGLLGTAAKKVPEEVAEQGLRRLADRGYLNNIIRRGVTGAAGEVPTEVAQQMLERSYAGLPLANEDAMAEYGEAAYASALGGGVLGGATGINERRVNRGNLEAFERKKIISDTPVVGDDGTVKGRMVLTQTPDGKVVRTDIDAQGKESGTYEYSGEQATNIFAYGKGKERASTPVNENDLVAQGFKKDEKKEETPPPAAADQEVAGDVETPAGADATIASWSDGRPVFDENGNPVTPGATAGAAKPLTGKQLTDKQLKIQAEIEAEAAKQGVTLTPDDLRKTVLFADKRNDADRPGDIVKRVAKIGKPVTPPTAAPAAEPANAAKVTYAGPEFDIPVYAYNEPASVGEDGTSYSRVRAENATTDSYVPTLDLKGFTPPAAKVVTPAPKAAPTPTETVVTTPTPPPEAKVTPTETVVTTPTPPTGTETTPTGIAIKRDQQRDDRIQQEGGTGTTVAATTPAAKVVTPAPKAAPTPDKTKAVAKTEAVTTPMQFGSVPAMKAAARQIANEMGVDISDADLDAIVTPVTSKSVTKREPAIRAALQAKAPATAVTSAPVDKTKAAVEAKPKAAAPVEKVETTFGLTPKLVDQVRKQAIPVMKEDTETVTRNLKLKRPTGGFGSFGQYVTDMGGDVSAAIRAVAGDLVLLDPKTNTSSSAEEKAQDTVDHNAAKKADKWIKKNLSKPAKASLGAQVEEFADMQRKGQAKAAKEDEMVKRRRAARTAEKNRLAANVKAWKEWLRDNKLQQQKGNPVDFADSLAADAGAVEAERRQRSEEETNAILDGLGVNYSYNGDTYLELDAAAASSIPMTEAQIDLANKGDLSGVLQNIEDDTVNADVKRLAKALKANIGDTKLEVVNGLTGSDGKQVAGLFDPKTNTIKLNSSVMLRPHTIMHETAHAATSHVLKNKSHPVTKALTKLFDDVKAQLDTEYGATSLEEFVAEVFSNVQFRQQLAAIMVSAGDGKQITAFQRFKNAVGNLLRTLMGKPTVSLDRKEDALTQADALIRNILSPAPNVRNAPEMYAMLTAGGKSAEPVMATILAPFRGASTKIDPQALARARAVLAPMSRKRVEIMTYLLPLNAQLEIAADVIPSAKGLFKLLQLKKGARENEMQKVSELKKILEKPFKGKVKQREIFNNVVAYSTLVKVDPSYSEAEAKKKYGKDPEKMAAYYDMVDKYWSKLTPAQQAAYKELRDYYSSQYTRIRNLIETRLQEFALDKDQRDKLRVLLLEEVLSKESIEPYFPLARSGKFWLEYEGINPYTDMVEHYKEAFDSETDREIAATEQRNNTARINQLKSRGLKEDSLKVRTYERRQNVSTLEKVPTGFAYRILNEMDAMKAPADVKNMITEMLLNAMPENSMVRMFKPRAGTMGFEADALTVLQDRAPSILTQITNLEYDGPLSKLQKKMQDDVDASDNPHKEVWLESFTKYIDYSRTPFIAPWARRFKSIGFLYTLGFNVSSVLVNMTNPAVVTYPYLGGQFGFDKAFKAMAKAHSVYMGAGGKKTGIPYATKRRSAYDLKYMDKLNQSGPDGVDTEIISAPNLSNIDFSDLSKVPADIRHYAALEEAMRTRGQSNRSMLTEVNEFNGENLYSTIVNLSGFMFHQGERMNRSISGIAAYDLKLEETLKGRPVSSATQKEMQDAADYAIEAIELTNSGSMAETAPRISQGGIGSVLFMYKRFGISMLYLQFRMLRQALKAGDLNKKERNIAKRQIVGLFLTSGAIAGIRGMPMVGLIIAAWNLYKEDDEEDGDTILQNYVGEGPFNGVLNYTFGLDIAPRIGMTDLLFRSLPNQEATSLADTAFNMAGPIAGIANRVYQGWDLMREGEVYRGAERMLPAVIANGMKSFRYAGEGATTLRGDPITEDIGLGHAFGQALGFAPAGYTRQLERNALDKSIDRSISETKRKLLRRYYLAKRENDFNTVMDISQEMLEFSLRHPETAITKDTIDASVRQHKITDEMTRQFGGITITRRRAATVMQERMEAGF